MPKASFPANEELLLAFFFIKLAFFPQDHSPISLKRDVCWERIADLLGKVS